MFYLLGVIIGLVISFFFDYCPADLDSGNVFWFHVHLETGTGSLGYLSDYQEHFYKKLRRINNNGKPL